MHSDSQFHFTVIQGKIRGRARVVKIKGAAALVVVDRVLKVGKHLMLVRATGGDGAHTNRLVQLHGMVEKGDDEKRGYVVRFLHAQCPAGLDVLVTFLQQEMGIMTGNPAVVDAISEQSGPVTFRFDTNNFEMGGESIRAAERDDPQPVYRATPIARRMPRSDDVAAAASRSRGRPLPAAAPPADFGAPIAPQRDERSLPDLEGDPDEFVSMFGMKVKRGQFDKLGDLTYKPGGAGNAVRSAKREDEDAGQETKKKRSTGFIKRVARKLTE